MAENTFPGGICTHYDSFISYSVIKLLTKLNAKLSIKPLTLEPGRSLNQMCCRGKATTGSWCLTLIPPAEVKPPVRKSPFCWYGLSLLGGIPLLYSITMI